MNRILLTVVLVLAATSLFAGGKNCDISKTASKNVELTGTLARVGSGDEAKTVFRVANSDQSYVVCHKTKAAILGLSKDAGARLQVKGKLVSCEDSDSLVIEEAKKV
ncbi:MAG TPA: hypothetical protein VGF28_26540 [Thermoanaerobaculia bacterium]|jgi:hypothetical protein